MDLRVIEHQQQYFRELDMEELEVEEVAHYSSSDDSIDPGHDGGNRESNGVTFDMCLTSLHTYLGEVDDTQHRVAILEGGAILSLPIFFLEGVVLFPDATLPLRVIHPRCKAALERALNQVEAPYTIGVIRLHRSPEDGSLCVATVGTTAEIRQYKRLDDGSVNIVTRGQQRFRLKRSWTDVEGASCAEVQIIQEDLPLRTPREAFGQVASVTNSWCRSLSISLPSKGLHVQQHLSRHEESDSDSMTSDFVLPELRLPESPSDSGNEYDRTDQLSNSDEELVCKSRYKLGKSHPNDSEGPSQQHMFRDEESDSDSMASDYALPELRLRESPTDSSNECDMTDHLLSSGKPLAGKSSYNLGKSLPNDSGGPSQSYSIYKKGTERGSASLGAGKLSISNEQSPKGGKQLGWSASASANRASRSFWPSWVFRMFDSYCLAQRAADMWKKTVGAPSMEDLINKPDLLSFYIASKLPVSESTRQELLEIDGISYRLRREIELLERFDRVHCKTCQTQIAKRSDMLVMSTDGPLGAFVNPQGYVHEIMTLYTANGIAPVGHPVKQYSWFPGYAWTVAVCTTCEMQLGWLFTATNKKLKPRSFWGIRSSQVADDAL